MESQATHSVHELGQHTPARAFVDAWLARGAPQGAPERRAQLLERAVLTLCERAVHELGELTAAAIVGQVAAMARAHLPLAAAQTLRTSSFASIAGVRAWIASTPVAERLTVLRFTLLELLAGLEGLTARLSTTELRAGILAADALEG